MNAVSAKLSAFLEQVTIARNQALQNGIQPSPALARANMANLSAINGKGPDVRYVSDGSFFVETDSRTEITFRIYSPDPTAKLPVILHLHGGGHMCGDLEIYDAISRRMAIHTNSVVITLDYRLSPEHPYPAAIEDCKFLLTHYQSLLGSVGFKDELILAGDSAGAALTATLSASAQYSAEISKQILLYPSLDYTMEHPSMDAYGSGYLLEKQGVAWYFDNYLQNGEDRKQVSPLFMPVPACMPETLLIVANCDPLQDEAYAYAEKLLKSSVSVQLNVFEGMVHGFLLLNTLAEEECDLVYELMNQFING
jgi:acetyl esterase|tara:strand:- start:23542 stop:24471 length:930 start_codon:yes stop_codon:yes gene_type:complete